MFDTAKQFIFLLFLFSQIFVTEAHSKTKRKTELKSYRLHYPHLTLNAEALDPLSVSLQQTPVQVKGSINSIANTLQTAINIGIFPNIEIGTTPVWYFVNLPGYNYNVKLQIFRNEELAFALSYYYQNYENTELNLWSETHGESVILNYRPYLEPWSVGWLLNTVQTDSAYQEDWFYNYETRFDFSYNIDSTLWFITGASYFYSDLYSYPGLGCSLAWDRPHKFLSLPTFGIHYFFDDFSSDNQKWTLTFNTTFY